jgi:hypothetical protein
MSSSPAAFGVGAQVFVHDVTDTDRSEWPTEPSGIITKSAGSAIQGVWGASGGRLWWIEFDEPQQRDDGEGPFASAQVHERFLELAPPYEPED